MGAMKIEELLASERRFEERVLVYLKDGPGKLTKLHLHFDRGATGEIGPALTVLASLNQIEVQESGFIQITRTGLARITRGKTVNPSILYPAVT